MDIALEFVDTFLADYIYAHLFSIGNSNETDTNSSVQLTEPWVWRPATKYFHVEPSQAAYMSLWTRDNPYRQFSTLYFTGWFFTIILNFSFATLLYHLVFDKRLVNHPKFMKNQIWNEIKMTNQSIPVVMILLTPLILLEVRGYSNLYDTTADGPGWWYNILQIPLFLLFADFCSYWIHRFSHHPRVYSHFLYAHKLHHRFIIPTPYASQAAHPTEGFLVAFPYIVFPLIFPLQKVVHLALIVAFFLWNFGDHDGNFRSSNGILSSSACHSLHHIHRKCNFGHYFNIFDRLHGTYRKPEAWMFQEERWLNETERKNESQLVKRNKENNDVFRMNSKSVKYE